jgi:hypothetical protein
MKKQLLFLPDIFLGLLILFSCERIDLTEWRKSTDIYPYKDQNTTTLQQVSVDSSDAESDFDIWKNYPTEYSEKAKSIFSNFRVKIGENEF